MGLPVELFLFHLERLPCLRTGGSGQWMQSLAGMFVLRGGYLVPFRDTSLPLLRSPVSLTMFRVCLPRAPAFRQVLEAMLAEGALESSSFSYHLPTSLGMSRLEVRVCLHNLKCCLYYFLEILCYISSVVSS